MPFHRVGIVGPQLFDQFFLFSCVLASPLSTLSCLYYQLINIVFVTCVRGNGGVFCVILCFLLSGYGIVFLGCQWLFYRISQRVMCSVFVLPYLVGI